MRKKHKFLKRMQWLTSTISITLVLLLLGLVVLFGLSAHQLSDSVRENLTITLLLDDDVDSTAAADFMHTLDSMPYTHRTLLITAEQALAEETARLGTDPSDFLDGQNPYTSTIELNVEADYACTDSLIPLSMALKEEWQVADVVYQQDLVTDLNKTLQQAMWVLGALAILLMVISVVLINNTVRLGVYSRRFIIHTMRLVGASWGFIRWPFIRRSMGIALTSALAAILLLSGGIWWAWHWDPFVSTIITVPVVLWMVAAVLVGGFLLTFVCTWLSVSHFLHMKENEMYN